MPSHDVRVDGVDQEDLITRTAVAMMRVDLGLVAPKVRERARALLKASGSEFDGQQLVDLCLEGRDLDGPATVKNAMLSLRSRLVGLETAVRRRRPSWLVRWTATATAKLIFFGIYTALILLMVFLIKRNWPAADLYEIGDKVLSFFKFTSG